MRSRTSRGVPDWSGGEELYIGSAVSAIESDLGVTGIVPGPPDGSRGSTGWGHPSRRAPWAVVGGGDQPLVGWCAPQGPPPAPRVGTLGWGGAHLPWGALHPPWPPPPWEIQSPRAGAPPGAYIKGGREGGSRTPCPGASLSLSNTSSSSIELGEALPEYCSSIPTTPSCCCWSHLPQPLLSPCWIKKEETLR